jgi:recombination protein RecR
MTPYPKPLKKLINALTRLPGIGGKTAQRLAFFIVAMPDEDALSIAAAITAAKSDLTHCSTCGNITDADPCPICADPVRDPATICVVESPRDVAAIERMRNYKGRYHVLHGAISPMDGIGPDNINLRSLIIRLQNNDQITEVILATNPNVEGEATAMYIAGLIRPSGLKVTRIAHGVPVGGDLDYTDNETLSRAINGRRDL